MRFFADGPNIPDELLEAQDNGKVVFFCGAGVSRPAGLPSFLGLAKQAMAELGTPIDAKSLLLLNRGDQDADFAVPLDQVFYLLQQEYGAATIDQIVSELLKTPPKAAVDFHKTILQLSRSASGTLQLVTTNFDLLFERADDRIKTYVPPALPDLAMGQSLDGLVYLHGRRAARPTTGITRQGLVISSADFGRAYLADGWATKFVRELLRNYVIVLLGYSATDPPVRYLLEGLHSLRDASPMTIYAFDQGAERDVQDRWRDRGVRPLAYGASDLPHEPLWQTLRAWAERAGNPNKWRQSVIDLGRKGPRELQAYQRGQVASLVRSTPGAKSFAEAEPSLPAEWLCVFDKYVRYAQPRSSSHEEGEYDPLAEYGLDDDPPRPPKSEPNVEIGGVDLISPLFDDERSKDRTRLAGFAERWSAVLPPRLFHLMRWITRVSEEPAAVWWAASYPALHPWLLDQLELKVERAGHSWHVHAYQSWILLLDKFRYSPAEEHGWYRFISKQKADGWTSHVLRDFERVSQPYLKSQRPWNHKPYPPSGNWIGLEPRQVIAFEVSFPIRDTRTLTIPPEQLTKIFAIGRRALERGSGLLAELGTRHWRTATFHFEDKPGERYIDQPSAYLHWIAKLFDRLAVEHPDFARSELARWPVNDEFFFDKLKIYAWMKQQLFAGPEAAAGLLSLSDEGFWELYHRRELLHTMRARWADFSTEERKQLEARITAGPPRAGGQSEDDYARWKDITAATILGWLEGQGCAISDVARHMLPELRMAEPRWQPSWDAAADDSHEGRSGFVKKEPDPSKIITAPLVNLISSARQHTTHSPFDFTRYEPFQGIVDKRPFRAVAALAYEARHGRFPVDFWNTALVHWPENTSERLRWLLARRIVRLPTDVVAKLNYSISDWFKKNMLLLARSHMPDVLELWDRIIDHLFAAGVAATESGIGDLTIAGKTQHRSRRTYEHAINSPVGRMAEVLFDLLDGLKLKGKSGIPVTFQSRLTRLFEAPGEGSDHAVSEATIRLRWLYYLDPNWVREQIIPLFQLDNARAEPSWNGYLHDNQMPVPALFELLKPQFLMVFQHISRWRWDDGPTDRLNEFLVIACRWSQKDARYISYGETRLALQRANDESRAHTVWFLGTIVRDQRAWKSFGKPFIKKAWPLEARFQTARTSHHLALMARDSGKHFSDVVWTILPLLVPVEHFDLLLIHRMNNDTSEGEPHLAAKFPEPMLALIDRLVPKEPHAALYDLASVLNMIADADPKLRQDARWRRLDHLVNQA